MLVLFWEEIPLDPQQKNTKQLPTTVTSHPHGVFHRTGHLDIARLTIHGGDAIPRF